MPKRHILKPNHVFWAITCQNLFQTVVCGRVEGTRNRIRIGIIGKRKNKQTKIQEPGKCILHQYGETLLSNRSKPNLAIFFTLLTLSFVSKFGIDWCSTSALLRCKICPSIETTADPYHIKWSCQTITHLHSTGRSTTVHTRRCPWPWSGTHVASTHLQYATASRISATRCTK